MKPKSSCAPCSTLYGSNTSFIDQTCRASLTSFSRAETKSSSCMAVSGTSTAAAMAGLNLPHTHDSGETSAKEPSKGTNETAALSAKRFGGCSQSGSAGLRIRETSSPASNDSLQAEAQECDLWESGEPCGTSGQERVKKLRSAGERVCVDCTHERYPSGSSPAGFD